MKKFLLSINFILIHFLLFAQNDQKTYETKYVEHAPKIDGVLDDLAWQNANIATDFVMFKPESNKPEPHNLKTEVKVVYDDEAVYVSAFMHNDKPQEIPMELQTRDNFGNADAFGVSINPKNDGINSSMFVVMSTGNQNDALTLSNGREDWSWNAVWYSDVKLVKNGWVVEIKIPYSALRFSNADVQTWSMNFHNVHSISRDQYTWNFIPRDKGQMTQYDGLVTGIKKVKPPIRLSFSPYASVSLDEYVGDYDVGWSAGLDLKYGISDSFTLDATLIPDFGQAAYDKVVLNLSAFETKFSEKRQFFTEGLDLFSKGEFFYTRRVGNAPVGRYDLNLNANEIVQENPNKVDMINAVKVSGRTKKGLGIGVFNAVTKPTYAKIQNTVEDTTREQLTEPLANYNVLVLDQQFNQNSSVSLVNTNVTRRGVFRDANVTGLLFDLKTKNNKYGISGGTSMSNIYIDDAITTGFEGNVEIAKISGNHQYDLEFGYSDTKYNKNDLGFQRRNNYMDIETGYSYRIFEPKGKFNDYSISFWTDISFLNKLDSSLASYQEKSSLYTGTEAGVRARATTRKHFSIGAGLNIDIGKQYDYYEPRIEGRFYKSNPKLGFFAWMSSDFRKQFALSLQSYFATKIDDSHRYLSVSLAPRYRVNDHMLIEYKVKVDKAIDEKGFVTVDNDAIIFGNRDVVTVENTLSTKYSFNTKSSLGFSFRHYWRPVDYDEIFYLLENDGTLSDSAHTANYDQNVNYWNLDLSYAWEFAPGSQLSVLYRNSIFHGNTDPNETYAANVRDMFKEPLANQLSLKLIYYLDYNRIRI